MKRTHSLFVTLFAVAFIIVILGHGITHAAGEYYFRWLPTTATCYDTYFETAPMYAEYNIPANSEYRMEARLNDEFGEFGPYPLVAETGSDVIFSYFAVGLSGGYPYYYSLRLILIVEGEPVYSSTLTFECLADGPTAVYLDNAAFTGPLFTDGRINPHPQASVVAYGNNPIRLYAVNPDDSRGDLLITLTRDELNALGIPEDGERIIADLTNPYSGASILLYRLANGGYRLQTTYTDGKPYIFEWDSVGGGLNVIAW